MDGRQGKALADTDLTASPVPIEKSADLEMDGKEDFKIFSAKWEGEMSKTTLRANNRPRRFLRFGYRVQTTKSADLEMDGREDFQSLLCLWAAALKQIPLRKGCRSRRILRMWVLPASRERRQRLPQKPHTPSESPRYFAAVG